MHKHDMSLRPLWKIRVYVCILLYRKLNKKDISITLDI